MADDEETTVTPYEVSGDVDYDKLLEQFGADRLSEEQVQRFPDGGHRLVRRRAFYAGRDINRVLSSIDSGEQLSVITGRGPSGSMHLGHIVPFYFAKYLQDTAGAHVYIPISDDEKHLSKELGLDKIQDYADRNIEQILGVGFDPEKTTIIHDTVDADVIYPIATRVANHITPATVDAVYGSQPNIGMQFYPAVQAAHLLLPQLIQGSHASVVPIAVDQDPHIRLARDIAGRQDMPAEKPAALLSKFLPTLSGPGKMSSSGDKPTIYLDADEDTVEEMITKYAHSGGKKSLKEHREQGGNPDVDVAFQYQRYFFEPSDDEVERLESGYEDGTVTSGEMKQEAVDSITRFLNEHQERVRNHSTSLEEFRLTEEERLRALKAASCR